MSQVRITISTGDPDDIEIVFPSEEVSMALPVTVLSEELVRIEAIPVLSEIANLFDVVKVRRQADGRLEFVCVVEPSHWTVHTLGLSREYVESPVFQALCSKLIELGCHCEHHMGGLLMVGAPPGLAIDLEQVLAMVEGSIH